MPSLSTGPKFSKNFWYSSAFSAFLERLDSSLMTRVVTARRILASAGVDCSISRETLSGRSSVSTTPWTKRSQFGNRSASSVMNMRRTCSRTLERRSSSTAMNGFMLGTNRRPVNSSAPSARQCRVAQGSSKPWLTVR